MNWIAISAKFLLVSFTGEDPEEEGKKKKLKHKRSAPQLERLESTSSGSISSDEEKGGVAGISGNSSSSPEPNSAVAGEDGLEALEDGASGHAGVKEKDTAEVDETDSETITGPRDNEWEGAEEVSRVALQYTKMHLQVYRW